MLTSFLPPLSPLLLGLTFAVFFLFHHFKKQKSPENLPDGTMGLPFFGETISFLKPHRSNSMGDFLQHHCSRYGKVFRSHVFGSPAIVSCDHELNMFVLQNEEKLFRASYPKSMHGILGKFSLLVVSGELHRKLRNVAVSFIASSRSNLAFLRTSEKLAVSMMESWRGSKEIALYEECKKFTLNLMVKQLMSIEPEDPLASTILEYFRAYMKGFVSLPVDFPGSAYAKAVKARERLSSMVKEIIREREERGNCRKTEGDFLDVMLSEEKLSDDEIVSIVLDIVLGGYETTSTLMALILYFLAQSPSALQTLKEEHENIKMSKEEGEDLDMKDYEKMEFTQNVIYEAMRCGNVVKFVHRKAIRDVKYKEYFIPSGWKVLPVFTAAHFDPSLHENPYEFNPWRWTDKVGMSKKVMPFGGGPRRCPGADLAKVEIAFFLHHLVLTYRWKTNADEFPVAYPYVEFKRGLVVEIEADGLYTT